MAILTAGERLDSNGRPQPNTGFEYDSEGPIAPLLEQRISPIISQPVTGEWIFGLKSEEDTGGEYQSGVVIFRPGNMGPPPHFHPTYDEQFEILVGEFLFVVDGVEQIAQPGDKLVVKQNVPHTFRCISDQYGALIGSTWPASNITPVLFTLFGMAHEGKLGPQGQPKFWHAMVIGEAFADNTVFTSPPPAVTLTLAKILGPIGRALGHQASDPAYEDPAFWEQTVNQPKPA